MKLIHDDDIMKLVESGAPSYMRRQFRPVVAAGLKAALIAGVVALVVGLGLLFRAPVYEAVLLMKFEPGHVKNEWDIMVDETRDIDFEEQIRSRAVLAPVLEKNELPEGKSSRLAMLPLVGGLFTRQELSPDQAMAAAVRRFQAHLTVDRIHHSSTLRIGVTFTSPELAARMANAVARSFIDLKRGEALEQLRLKSAAMERELARVQEDLAAAMDQRNAFFRQHGWNDYALELANATGRVTALKQELLKLDMAGAAPGGAVEAGQAASQDDAAWKQFNEKMNQINERYLQVKSRFKDDSPLVQEAARERAGFEQFLRAYALERAAKVRQDIDERKAVVAGKIEEAQAELRKLVNLGPDVQEFQGVIDHARGRQQDMAGQRSLLRMQADAIGQNAAAFGDLRIIDHAVAPERVTPAGRFFGIAVSTAAVFLAVWCLMLIIFELWNQALVHHVRQSRQGDGFTGKFL